MSLLNGPTLCLHLGSCNVIDNAMFKPRILDLDIRKNFAFFQLSIPLLLAIFSSLFFTKTLSFLNFLYICFTWRWMPVVLLFAFDCRFISQMVQILWSDRRFRGSNFGIIVRGLVQRVMAVIGLEFYMTMYFKYLQILMRF